MVKSIVFWGLDRLGRNSDLVIAMIFAIVFILVCLSCVNADDSRDRDRRATAAWHMTAPAIAAAGKCECEPGTRGPFAEQFLRVAQEHRVMVAFFGTEPRCCKGTMIGVATQVPVGYNAARPIVVYYPIDGYRIGISETLPADAGNAELVRAVKSAQAKVVARPK